MLNLNRRQPTTDAVGVGFLLTRGCVTVALAVLAVGMATAEAQPMTAGNKKPAASSGGFRCFW